MSTKTTNVLLAAAIAATTVMTSMTPVSATPVWLPGKVRGQPHLSVEKSPEVVQAERERQLRLRQQQAQRQGNARAHQSPRSGSAWQK